MLILEILMVAWRGIVNNKLQTILTMLGIVVGVGTVILLVAYSKGTERMLLENFEKWGSNRMGGYLNFRRARNVPASVRFEMSDIERLRKQKRYVDRISGELQTQADVRYGNSILEAHSISASEPDIQVINNLNIGEGRWFTDEENIMRERVCVIGSLTREKLFFAAPALDQFIMVGGKRFRVVGVLESKGSSRWENPDEQVIIPLYTGLDRLPGIDPRYLGVGIRLTDAKLSDQAEEHFTLLMHEKYPFLPLPDEEAGISSPFNFWSAAEWQVEREATASSLSGFLLITGLMSLLIGSVGVMNIMLVTVQERTREIGLRKAVGASRGGVLGQFLIETAVICLIGGALGTLFAWVACRYLAKLPEEAQVPEPVMTSGAILLATLITLGVAMAAGMYPAARAAQLDPIKALHNE